MMMRVAAALPLALAVSAAAAGVKVYPHYMDPRMHPDEERREVKPPNRAELGDRTHFMALRQLSEKNYKAEMDRYVVKDGLGDFVWGYYRHFLLPNFKDVVREIKARNLYYFDIVGFIPGVGMGPDRKLWGGLTQVKLTPEEVAFVKGTLGDKWLGMDNGEQDGRYMGWAQQAVPHGVSCFDQYCHFQDWFERLDELQGNKMAALTGLCYGHYFLRENCYTFLGAETAQSLPNAQLFYSFIRGAGKQYGVPWFGNVSLFGPTGWKEYTTCNRKVEKGKGPGPENGASLALMKKLMMAQIFYNSQAVGFEMGYYFTEDGKEWKLSPIGKLQQDIMAWLGEYGEPGVMHAPVAVMLDFFSGWTFARHWHYAGGVFRKWATIPFDRGDYFTDGVLSMLYPEYDDAAYFYDEHGFNVDTPYGDMADCVLSDAPAWCLAQYPLVVLTTDLSPTQELKDTLGEYLAGGGRVVLTETNQRNLCLKGDNVVVIPGDGLRDDPAVAPPVKDLGRGNKLPRAHPLSPEARSVLDREFRAQMVFGTSKSCETNGLSFVTCRKGPGEYTVLVINNTWRELPLELLSFAGKVRKIVEQKVPSREKTAVGYYPTFVEVPDPGRDTARTIAAGAVRVFRVFMDEAGAIEPMPAVRPRPNARNATLFLHNVAGPIKREILRRPTFSRHFDSVMVDWKYVLSRDDEDLAEQTNFLRLQQIGVMVDLSSGLDLFPNLRFIENDPNETPRVRRKLERLLAKMEILGAKDIAISLHCRPANMSQSDFEDRFVDFAKRFCKECAAKGIRVHVRGEGSRGLGDFKRLSEFTGRIGEPNCTMAPRLESEMRRCGMNIKGSPPLLRRMKAPLWYVSAGGIDENRQGTSSSSPINSCGVDEDVLLDNLRALHESAGRVVFDAVYPDLDSEYRDILMWERAGAPQRRQNGP